MHGISAAVPLFVGRGPEGGWPPCSARGCPVRAQAIPNYSVCPRHLTIAGETRSDARVASEGPRATVSRAAPFPVGRGPVPRHAALAGAPFGLRRSRTTVSVPHRAANAGDRPPRYGMRGRLRFTVGRGPVPRRAAIAGETRSDARVASEGPRAPVSRAAPFTVGRGPVPRHVSVREGLAGDRPPRYVYRVPFRYA